jgi:hypothetical protein
MMAPARKIRHLRCSDRFADAARAVLAARIEEVEDRRALIAGPDDPQPLHDLRIAAKRLRYSLETFAVAFPPGEAEAHADRIRDLQDILGRIHDLDVLEDLLLGQIEQMDREARAGGVQIARGEMEDGERRRRLEALVWGDQRHARLGVYSTIAVKADERRRQYARFEALWSQWQENGVLQSIRAMIGLPAGDEKRPEGDLAGRPAQPDPEM